jgi:Spx/MgsR family transcriptional regulator
MIVYLHKKCSTCQHARSFLEAQGCTYAVKDIVATPPTLLELERMLDYQAGNIRKLFNTSGILYREMGLATKLATMPKEEALQLLSQNGMLIKRPFLLAETFGLLGFQEAQWHKALSPN